MLRPFTLLTVVTHLRFDTKDFGAFTAGRVGGMQTLAARCRAVAHRTRWEDVKAGSDGPSPSTRAVVEQHLAMGQLIHHLRVQAGLSQRDERWYDLVILRV